MRRRSRPPRDHQRRPERHIASLGDKGRPHPFVTTEPCLNRRLELWNVLRSLAAAHVRSAGDRAYVRARCALRARAVPLLSLHQAEPGRSPDGNPDGKLGPVRAGPEPGTRMPGRRHCARARADVAKCAEEEKGKTAGQRGGRTPCKKKFHARVAKPSDRKAARTPVCAQRPDPPVRRQATGACASGGTGASERWRAAMRARAAGSSVWSNSGYASSAEPPRARQTSRHARAEHPSLTMVPGVCSVRTVTYPNRRSK